MHYGSNYQQVFMPYCMVRIGEGKDEAWIFLNRRYKPVGVTTNSWVKYEDGPLYKIKGFTKKRALAICGSANLESHWPDRVYFYDDGTNPSLNKKNMEAYLKRISKLMALTIQRV